MYIWELTTYVIGFTKMCIAYANILPNKTA